MFVGGTFATVTFCGLTVGGTLLLGSEIVIAKHGDATWIRTPGIPGVDAQEILVDAGNCRVMDGGRAKWEAEGRTLTTDVRHYESTDYESRRSARSSHYEYSRKLSELTSRISLTEAALPMAESGYLSFIVYRLVDDTWTEAVRIGVQR